jgi:DNA mismatch repair protein MutS2
MRDGQIVPQESNGTESVAGESDRTKYVSGGARAIVVGDKVKLRAFGSIGIVDQIKGDEVEVRVKALRFREKLENLELVEAVSAPQSDGGRFAKLRSQSAAEVSLHRDQQPARVELNVIGQATDEAVDAVDKFLDAAFMQSQGRLRIIHGHGTGALRRAIAELLKGHPHVERFLAAPQDQGGSGATVVELKS